MKWPMSVGHNHFLNLRPQCQYYLKSSVSLQSVVRSVSCQVSQLSGQSIVRSVRVAVLSDSVVWQRWWLMLAIPFLPEISQWPRVGGLIFIKKKRTPAVTIHVILVVNWIILYNVNWSQTSFTSAKCPPSSNFYVSFVVQGIQHRVI